MIQRLRGVWEVERPGQVAGGGRRRASPPPGVSATGETASRRYFLLYISDPSVLLTRRYFFQSPDPSVLFSPGTRRYFLFDATSDPSVLLQKYRRVGDCTWLRLCCISPTRRYFQKSTDGAEMRRNKKYRRVPGGKSTDGYGDWEKYRRVKSTDGSEI